MQAKQRALGLPVFKNMEKKSDEKPIEYVEED